MKPLRIGDLERATGKTARALHLYEEQGLLPRSERSAGNYRLFQASAIARVQWIETMQRLGLTLPEIKQRLDTFARAESAPAAMADLRASYEAQLRDVEGLAEELRAGLAYLDACAPCTEQGRDACTRCNHHPETPPLIEGIR